MVRKGQQSTACLSGHGQSASSHVRKKVPASTYLSGSTAPLLKADILRIPASARIIDFPGVQLGSPSKERKGFRARLREALEDPNIVGKAYGNIPLHYSIGAGMVYAGIAFGALFFAL